MKKSYRKIEDLKEMLNGRDPWKMKFEPLLNIVDKLFPTSYKASSYCYNYTIGRFPHGWCFSVVNSWYKWNEKGLNHQFGAYAKPEFALAAFLEYCLKENIKPHKLSE